jgi:hypothetical protein
MIPTSHHTGLVLSQDGWRVCFAVGVGGRRSEKGGVLIDIMAEIAKVILVIVVCVFFFVFLLPLALLKLGMWFGGVD